MLTKIFQVLWQTLDYIYFWADGKNGTVNSFQLFQIEESVLVFVKYNTIGAPLSLPSLFLNLLPDIFRVKADGITRLWSRPLKTII